MAVYHVEVRPPADPAFAQLARWITFPQRETGRESQFWPAYSGFDIAAGTHVDVSFLESSSRAPKTNFDRHMRTEELFVCFEGEYIMPMARCRNPDDPEDVPHLEDFLCFRLKAGEFFVLKPNVWHSGGWPAPGSERIRLMTILSGHRAGGGHQGRVDYIVKGIPGEIQILPNRGYV